LFFSAIGDGGNIIHADCFKNIVIAITSQFIPRAKKQN